MFTYNSKLLTIKESDLTEVEAKTVKTLIRLGDSLELALWTIEHQERSKQESELYGQAYEVQAQPAAEVLELGNNESISRGVIDNQNGTFTALTFTQSKTFKTRKGAYNWYKRKTAA